MEPEPYRSVVRLSNQRVVALCIDLEDWRAFAVNGIDMSTASQGQDKDREQR